MSNIKKEESQIEPLENLVEQIIRRVGLDDLPEGDKKYFKENLTLQLNRRLGLIIVENLNDEGRLEYAKLLDEQAIPEPKKMQDLLIKYLPDYQVKIKDGLDEFVGQIVDSLNKEKK
jgi:hypothetical protein